MSHIDAVTRFGAILYMAERQLKAIEGMTSDQLPERAGRAEETLRMIVELGRTGRVRAWPWE